MIPVIDMIMAFDFGIKNIGVAVGQKLTYSTQPVKVLKSKLGFPNWKTIDDIYHEWHPTILIVGLPLQMNGTEQPITILAKKFAKQLKKRFKTTVEMQDERFSTIEARSNYLKYTYFYFKKIKNNDQINAIAAAIILKSWLNKHLY